MQNCKEDLLYVYGIRNSFCVLPTQFTSALEQISIVQRKFWNLEA